MGLKYCNTPFGVLQYFRAYKTNTTLKNQHSNEALGTGPNALPIIKLLSNKARRIAGKKNKSEFI